MSSSRFSSIGPVSRPSSICMMVTPLTSSPARIARWIGAAPRQRGSSEAWMFTHPALRRIQDRLRQDQPISRDHREIRVQRGKATCSSSLRSVRASARRCPARRPAHAPRSCARPCHGPRAAAAANRQPQPRVRPPTSASRLGTAKSGDPMKMIRIAVAYGESRWNCLPRSAAWQSEEIEALAGARRGFRDWGRGRRVVPCFT